MYGQTQSIINAYMQNQLELTHPSLTTHIIIAVYDTMEPEMMKVYRDIILNKEKRRVVEKMKMQMRKKTTS